MIERHHIELLEKAGKKAQEQRMQGILPGNWCKPRTDDIAEVIRTTLGLALEEVLIEDLVEGWVSTIRIQTRGGQSHIIALNLFLCLYHFVAMTRQEIILAGLEEP
mgnify:CR=1 FL=1